ncbi:MAG TPA: class I SAM-dependent methyltransferase [Rudaea sp.]|jgi:hypothetical protein
MNGADEDSRETAFSRIFRDNAWGSDESRSGLGSTLHTTQRLRMLLPALLRGLNVRSMLDAPCGDFNWMRHVDLGDTRYVGCDIVGEIVLANRAAHPDREFVKLDLVEDKLPPVDLIFSRDCLQHLPEPDIWRALRNFRRSGATWLFTSSHTVAEQSISPDAGGFGFLNLQLAPFGLPLPLLIVPEEHYASKAMALWKISDLPT